MDLGARIDVAVSAAIGEVMTAYAQQRTGHVLPPLSWALGPEGLLIGWVGAGCAPDEVAGLLIRWAEALGLTPAAVSPHLAGSVAYEGTVEGRAVHLWGVVDRDTWGRS